MQCSNGIRLGDSISMKALGFNQFSKSQNRNVAPSNVSHIPRGTILVLNQPLKRNKSPTVVQDLSPIKNPLALRRNTYNLPDVEFSVV